MAATHRTDRSSLRGNVIMVNRQAVPGQVDAPVDWQIEVFYDGDCPLCAREIAFLRRLDRRRQIRFTDIAAPDFCSDEYGLELDEFMAEIHGRLPDGEWVRGVEVFRRLYSAVGCGPIVWITRLPLIRILLDRAYATFARNRLRWTGRCSVASGCQYEPRKTEAPQEVASSWPSESSEVPP